MRIISGKLGGRVLNVPKGLPVRPTTDRTKEALFNILSNRFDFEGLRVLDLFCGTGNISLECFSRGAANIVAIDKDKRCVQAVKHFFKEFGVGEGRVLQADIFKEAAKFNTLLNQSFDLVFLDPPYAHPNQHELVSTLFAQGLLSEHGLLVIEHSTLLSFGELSQFQEVRKYGSSAISFLG